MKGFIEHDGRACALGRHSNRVPTTEMCPVFLELRRNRLKAAMRWSRFVDRAAAAERRDLEGMMG